MATLILQAYGPAFFAKKSCDLFLNLELDNQDNMTLFYPTFNEELENLNNYAFIVVMVSTFS